MTLEIILTIAFSVLGSVIAMCILELIERTKTIRIQNLEIEELMQQAWKKDDELTELKKHLHKCKYCGAITAAPDEECYANPSNQNYSPEEALRKIKEIADRCLAPGWWPIRPVTFKTQSER